MKGMGDHKLKQYQLNRIRTYRIKNLATLRDFSIWFLRSQEIITGPTGAERKARDKFLKEFLEDKTRKPTVNYELPKKEIQR